MESSQLLVHFSWFPSGRTTTSISLHWDTNWTQLITQATVTSNEPYKTANFNQRTRSNRILQYFIDGNQSLVNVRENQCALELVKIGSLSKVIDNCFEWSPYSTVGSLYISFLASYGVTTIVALVQNVKENGKIQICITQKQLRFKSQHKKVKKKWVFPKLLWTPEEKTLAYNSARLY